MDVASKVFEVEVKNQSIQSTGSREMSGKEALTKGAEEREKAKGRGLPGGIGLAMESRDLGAKRAGTVVKSSEG